MERDLLNNGRFLHDLGGWTVSGAEYNAGDGDDHYGVAVLSTGGDSIAQSFAVPRLRTYTLHLALKGLVVAGQVTAVIQDGAGNTVKTMQPTGSAGSWTETTYEVGLAPGTTYTLTITNVNAAGDVLVDDVWLWNCPMSRLAMAARVDAKLARLATQRSLTTTPNGALTEGSYTYAVDAGLRSVGAVNDETGQVDVRWLDEESLQTCLDAIEREMLEQLQRDFAVEVDIQVGPRRESLSQTAQALKDLTGGASKGQGRVITRKLHHQADDYEFS